MLLPALDVGMSQCHRLSEALFLGTGLVNKDRSPTAGAGSLLRVLVLPAGAAAALWGCLCRAEGHFPSFPWILSNVRQENPAPVAGMGSGPSMQGQECSGERKTSINTFQRDGCKGKGIVILSWGRRQTARLRGKEERREAGAALELLGWVREAGMRLG